MDRILAQGSRVVLVDLPIPRWHAGRSPLYREYLRRKLMLLLDLEARAEFSYLEMNDLNGDPDFSDEVHPKPRVTRQWAARIAGLISAVGDDVAPESRVSKQGSLAAVQP
jgi:hypothetical protein